LRWPALKLKTAIRLRQRTTTSTLSITSDRCSCALTRARQPFVSRTHPTAQTEGVQARVGASGQCPPLARHEIKHLNRYDLSNEYRVSGWTRVAGDGQIDGSLLRWACSSSSDKRCQSQAIPPAPGNKIYTNFVPGCSQLSP
jgi:hypothetical protein